MKKLIVLCDGTWCGSTTNTKSNIYLLASMIMNGQDPYKNNIYDNKQGIKARYFQGSGTGDKTFLQYIFEGATGSDLGQDCIEVYQYIVQHFTKNHEIWMFGLSRGAYTVRCVAGMINNCGILRRRDDDNNVRNDENDGVALNVPERYLCEEVYKIYRSPYPEDAPKSPKSIKFRKEASYTLEHAPGSTPEAEVGSGSTPEAEVGSGFTLSRRSPIRFMGLFDTVGSRGIPKLDAGIGLHYPEFYDQCISSEVKEVYHALAIHDRLWIFQPCRALRTEKYRDNPAFPIHEHWFPGAHYDLACQQFRFLRDKDIIAPFDAARHIAAPVEDAARHIAAPIEDAARHIAAPVFGAARNITTHIEDAVRHITTHVEDAVRHITAPVADDARHITAPVGGAVRHITAPVEDAARRIIASIENAADITRILGVLSMTVKPNKVFAAFVLQWMLQRCNESGLDIDGIDDRIERLTQDMMNPNTDTGSGDIYGHTLTTLPAGQLLEPLEHIFSVPFPDVRIIINALAQTRDRRIADYDYTQTGDRRIVGYNVVVTEYETTFPMLNGAPQGNESIEVLGDITRYSSKTYTHFETYLKAMGYTLHGFNSL